MNELYVSKLSRMIQMETVSEPDPAKREKFRGFQELLRELFPALFSVCEFKDYAGSFLLRWPGKESPEPAKQGLLLMNHQDVVPAGNGWTHEAFSGEFDGERIWGRGTLDDKGGLWAMLQAADELISEGFVPQRDVWFESACTEELAGEGARTIAADLKEKGYRFEMVLDEGGAIIKDPVAGAKCELAMIGVGEKGCADLKFIARSAGGHSSTPPKNTPLVRLGRFMSYIDRNNIFEVKLAPAVCELLRRNAPYMEGIAAKAMASPEKFAPIIKKVMNSDPTSAAMLKTTLAFTRACGSDANNVIPDEAWVIGNMRFSHHQGRDRSIEAAKKAAKRFDIEVEIVDPGYESGLTDWNGEAFKLVEKAVAEIFPGIGVAPYIMLGGSDSRFMTEVSDNCLRFLPYRLTAEQKASIHAKDEYVNADDLEPAVNFYRYLIRSF